MYVNSARVELRRKGITVTDILPGYIKTDIVEGVDIGKLPFAISVEQAAREMTRLIEKTREIRRRAGFSVEAGATIPWSPARAFHASLGRHATVGRRLWLPPLQRNAWTSTPRRWIVQKAPIVPTA